MKELQLQNLIIDVVRDHGGAARKLSHRFSVGVPDLIVKVPGVPAVLFEVKKNKWPVRGSVVKLDVTVPQLRFLKEFSNAGMDAGVISFAERDRMWRISIVSVMFDDYRSQKGVIGIGVGGYNDFSWKDRSVVVWSVLEGFLNESIKYV